jgi:hypothetical protein
VHVIGARLCHDRIDHARAPPEKKLWCAMKKALGWILLALVIFYIGTNPGPAADTFRELGSGIADVFRNIGTFFSELTT